ncbi:class I SAM-dependent methyltransferase [Nocardioides sp.]|uniref:class I SAM-dependent methyltransferase n=1 Tax=Nocardioides sp. TaxID=35761 RepID=UPI0025F70B27|nr:class I SAM-dependent methyltransferase [Nocardioides sp.]
MAFDVAAGAYARFMGRYSEPLADQLVELAGVRPGQRAVDVGCGPGVLTARLADRLGAENVVAIDPSPPFVEAARERCPGVDVRYGRAEALPFADAAYDAVLANLVVHFMSDPVRGLQEMGRVARPDGVVAATVWNHATATGPLSTFWQAAQELDPDVADEAALPGTGEGDLGTLARQAGLQDVEEGTITVSVPYSSFEEWWEPYTLGVGPAGDHVRQLDEAARTELREHCRALLPDGPFTIDATAWSVVART